MDLGSNDLVVVFLTVRWLGNCYPVRFLGWAYCYHSVFIMVTVKVNMSVGRAYSLICYCSIGSTVVLVIRCYRFQWLWSKWLLSILICNGLIELLFIIMPPIDFGMWCGAIVWDLWSLCSSMFYKWRSGVRGVLVSFNGWVEICWLRFFIVIGDVRGELVVN